MTREMPVAGDEEQSHAADDLSGEVPDRGLTERDKKMVKELHSKMGHPANADFSRMLRLARARTPVWRYAQKEFECDICKGQQRPKAARPSVPPACLAPGQVVGVDVVFFPGVNPREAQPVLNIIDWGSCYQMLEPLDSKSSAAAWSAFQRSWMRTFGVPQIIVCDQGREFLGSFAEKLMQMGCAHKTIGARAPWQQGRTERHGGLAKLVFLKLREEDPPSNLEEWKACIYAVEAAKNRMYHKSGFSPAQRQLGENVRLPGTLGSDDVYDPALLVAGAGEQVRRILEMRRKAMEAFVRCSAEEAISRASKARPRVVREFLAGDLVYVYRTPLPRKRNRDEEERPEARELRRPVWVGPGVVVSKEGPNVWIAVRGELWKCACEQVRLATNVEHEAHGMLRDEVEELRIEMMRKSSKRAFKDISKWEHPPEGEEELAEGEPPAGRRRLHGPGSATPGTGSSSSTSSTTSSSSSSSTTPGEELEEPEREVSGEATGAAPTDVPNPDSEVAGEGNYGPIRPRLQRYHDEPYGTGLWCVTRDLKEVEEQHTTPLDDYWEYVPQHRVLRRVHQTERVSGFVPSLQRGCPVPPNKLKSARRTVMEISGGGTYVQKGNWRYQKHQVAEGPPMRWRGYTDFYVQGKDDELLYLVKKGSDEVREDEITPEDWEKWRVADGEEWSKVSATEAVKELSVEESREVRRQLEEANLSARILPSRVVRRWKPADQPGQPPSMKSRWCIRGDRDPDLLLLDRHAPTVTTSNIAIAMQLAASKKWRTAVGDLKNAFMQSERLKRAEGRLFASQPRGGLPGLESEQLIEILAGAYGLGDAPAHWRRSLKKVLLALGFTQSKVDPCTFKMYTEKKENGCEKEISGLVIVEVDDLLCMGDHTYFQIIEQLRQKFTFGKFVFLDESPDGVSFNGRRLKNDGKGGFLIDMKKFINERLFPVELERGRKSMLKEPATREEREAARAAVGALTWAAKEGRPDGAATASLVASSLKVLTVGDIVDLNKCIEKMKETAGRELRIQHIPEDELCWGVISDASYANVRGGRSQGGFCIVVYEKKVAFGEVGKCNLLHWKSSKIHRVVNSTLAAETQAMSRGLSELMWAVTVFQELVNPHFDMKEWQDHLKNQRMESHASTNSSKELRNLAITDARSIFDHLTKETSGYAADKRTAIEMQVIQQHLRESGAHVKWVPNPAMIADVLTKRGGNAEPLNALLDSGTWSVVEVKKNFR